jgi:Xaa-Pro aminopeptidase
MITRARRMFPLALLLGAATATARAQEPSPQGAVPARLDVRAQPLSRPGDGSPVCGLGKAFHAGRRAALRARLGKGLILVRGLPDTRDYVSFRQDKSFWYLTGVESPDAALLMDAETGLEMLFLPPRDARQEIWDGERWDAQDTWIPELTGVAVVKSNAELLAVLDELAHDREVIHVPLGPAVALSGCHDRAGPADKRQLGDPLDGRPSRERRLADVLSELTGRAVVDCSPALAALRQVKGAEELAALRRAAHAGALGMIEAIRSTRPGLGEWDLRAVMDMVHRRAGADGPAYDAIVGSGPNSVTLHYMADNRVMQPGEMICLDYGPEVDHYTTDITRSWPTDGQFTPRMAELYDAVLAAQAAGIAAARPGVTLLAVEQACNKVLTDAGFGHLIRHGNCHWLGLEVHDVGDYLAVLQPGFVFTIEPGLYDADQGIGIRIEDVVAITADGCEVLTALVPKDRASIGALVAAPGVLDDMDASADRDAPDGTDSPAGDPQAQKARVQPSVSDP